MRRERLGDNAVKINTRDRLLRAWENSMELVLDYQTYKLLAGSRKQEIKDNDDVCRVFDQFAEDEAMHARRFRQLLQNCQDEYLKD